MFFNSRDAAMRLNGTVVRQDGKAVYVHDFDNWSCRILDMESEDSSRVDDVRKAGLDLSCVPLGYCNIGNYNSYYLQRVPVRAWKQGLSNENLAVDGKVGELGSLGIGIHHSAIAEVVEGSYLTYTKALDKVYYLLEEGRDSVKRAFSRKFAVGIDDGGVALFYKGRIVGSFDGREWELKRNYVHLTEALTEAINESV